MTRGIYAITNTITGEQYIGASNNIANRWTIHRANLRGGRHNAKLQAAWDEYGADAFTFDVLEEVADSRALDNREQHYLNERHARAGNHGYNMQVAPGSGFPSVAEDLDGEQDDDRIAKYSFTMSRHAMARLRAITKARHGRVDGFMSATVDQIILDAFAKAQ